MSKTLKQMILIITLIIFLIGTQYVIAEENEQENHHEQYENDQYEHEDEWDFSDDFQKVIETPVEISPVETPPVETANLEQLAAENERLQQALAAATEAEAKREEEINALNKELTKLQQHEDEDHDGVPNSLDNYPGADDRRLKDSDNDGIVDAEDLFPGENDLNYQDADKDGVKDSEDTDTTKDTDSDNDGIDDAFDTHDDRPFIAKLLGLFGLIH